jgi:hypothetical protein
MKIITIEHKNTKYIDMQYKTIKKHVKNNIDYIVYNNACLESNEYFNINEICKQLNIKVVNFFPNGGNCSDPSQAHCYALLKIWEDFKDSNEKILIINSDMFFFKDIDLEKAFGNNQMSIVPWYSSNPAYHKDIAAWGGIIYIDTKNIPKKNSFDLSLGIDINGERVDTGGKTRDYFKFNKIDIKYLELWIVNSYDNNLIDVSLNGNQRFLIKTLDDKKIITADGTTYYDNKTFEYELERENYNDYLIHNYEYVLNNIKKYNFPTDLCAIQFIKFHDDDIEDSFIIHQQGGSNYINKSEEYMNQRWEAIVNFLKDRE